MNSHRKYRGTFASRPSSETSSSDESTLFERPSKRKANVYDAVAGRVTLGGLLGNVTDTKASNQPLRPDEVLFKQANAPIRYEETDYYRAHENLPADQRLPTSDLLSAVHAYVSVLYSRTAVPGTQKAWKCMDETALIAFGILMEEIAREKLGETGDLAFIEAVDEEEEKVLARDVEEGEEDIKKRSSVSGATRSEEEERSDPWSSFDGSRYTSEESE